MSASNRQALLENIPPAALAAYAYAHGWRQKGIYGHGGTVLTKANAFDVIMPTGSDFADYAFAVEALVTAWAADERRPVDVVFRDLLQVDRDVIRVRAPQAAQDGSIAVEAGVALFQNAREMLLAAACAAREPKRSYRVGSHKEAHEYIETVRLGQTEQGSYVVTMLSPVPLPPAGSAPLAEPSEEFLPFERRVTTTLIISLASAHKSAQSVIASGRASDFDKTVLDGVNANLCDAVASLIDEGAGLDVTVAWAPALPAPEPSSIIRFSKEEASVLRQGAAYLRSSEPKEVKKLEGYVSSLGRDEDRADGQITLKAVVEGKLVSVKARLHERMYDDALDAHGRRKSIVVAGRLEKVGARWHLIGAHDFQIVEDPDELILDGSSGGNQD